MGQLNRGENFFWRDLIFPAFASKVVALSDTLTVGLVRLTLPHFDIPLCRPTFESWHCRCSGAECPTRIFRPV